MKYQIIQSSSGGNSVLYHNFILVDIGVPYNVVKSYKDNIQIILLTHTHSDHINMSTLEKLSFEKPLLRIGACEWMWDNIKDLRNVDIYEIGKLYDYGKFMLSPIKLYHDVPNCGYRIFKDDYKILHATDTAHLEGISAKDYDLYAIEHNYNEERLDDIVKEQQEKGEFSHIIYSRNAHLSEQQAKDFIYKNKADYSEVLRLHESSTYL